MRRAAALLIVLLAAASDLGAQTSLYGVLGLGYPGRPSGARSRILGSGPDGIDRESALNPAAIGEISRLAIVATSLASFRNYEIDTVVVNDLRDTRFPYASVAGVIPKTPVTFAASYSIYAERTYDLVNEGTIELRGDSVDIVDNVTSDGAIADLRAALGWDLNGWLVLGAGFHILTGSTHETLTRLYSDTTNYLPLNARSQVSYSGLGVSAGVLLSPFRRLLIGASFRSDGNLDVTRDSVPGGTVNLPMTISGGVEYRPWPKILFATTVVWRSWSDANEGMSSDADTAFDTWEIGAGVELNRTGTIPVRLGFRYAQLPFSPTAEQPREIDLSLGTALRLAQGRAAIDMGIERAMRDGGGASERAWQISLGLLLLP
jgi:opacity protein-like surface antigen